VPNSDVFFLVRRERLSSLTLIRSLFFVRFITAFKIPLSSVLELLALTYTHCLYITLILSLSIKSSLPWLVSGNIWKRVKGLRLRFRESGIMTIAIVKAGCVWKMNDAKQRQRNRGEMLCLSFAINRWLKHAVSDENDLS